MSPCVRGLRLNTAYAFSLFFFWNIFPHCCVYLRYAEDEIRISAKAYVLRRLIKYIACTFACTYVIFEILPKMHINFILEYSSVGRVFYISISHKTALILTIKLFSLVELNLNFFLYFFF